MIPLPSVSTSVASKSGDASGALDSSFNYNAAFQVGGSGSQSQDAGLSAGGSTDTLAYIGIGVGVLAIILTAISLRRS